MYVVVALNIKTFMVKKVYGPFDNESIALSWASGKSRGVGDLFQIVQITQAK